jgi:hypothetical protein
MVSRTSGGVFTVHPREFEFRSIFVRFLRLLLYSTDPGKSANKIDPNPSSLFRTLHVCYKISSDPTFICIIWGPPRSACCHLCISPSNITHLNSSRNLPLRSYISQYTQLPVRDDPSHDELIKLCVSSRLHAVNGVSRFKP